jgi:CoA:oxalate CoA-transferase
LALNEAIMHPHLRERKTVRGVQDRLIGEFDIPGLPAKFSQWPENTALHADMLGEHNEEVLRALLNLSDREIAALYADKVLVRDPWLEHACNASRETLVNDAH